MSPVAFLLAALVLSVVGCAILVLRHRTPTSLEHGVDSFGRQMEALVPERRRPGAGPARGGTGPHAAPPPGGAGPGV